jgi:hypothetical protein
MNEYWWPCLPRRRRRAHGVPAGELHRAPAHRRGACWAMDLGRSRTGETFSIVIQLGAVLCLPIYFPRPAAARSCAPSHGARAGDRNRLEPPA